MALRVLVIEDNPDTAESMRLLASLLGCEAHACLSGEEGLALARAWRPDVVLCDIGLPGLSGYEVAEALRREESVPQLVAITGYGSRADQERALQAGFEQVFTKPADFPAVMEYVLRRRLAGPDREH